VAVLHLDEDGPETAFPEVALDALGSEWQVGLRGRRRAGKDFGEEWGVHGDEGSADLAAGDGSTRKG
jgi:hypothetical protein